MKPLYLEMTAFGSYGETAKIDFSDFSDNLYLITGDTGAGKTTIFDAIMMALYGVTCGKKVDLQGMHSDYVGRDVMTEVLLIFCHNGKEYKVKRTFRYKRKGLGSPEEMAYLWEPDRDLRDKQVTARIVEILGGINEDKFRKIVMLAQGEFKKFLVDNSDAKGKILGELFDSSPYEYYQNLLGAAKVRLESTRREYEQEIENAMKNFEVPAGMDENCESFLPKHTALLDNLEALVLEDALQSDLLMQKKEETQEVYQKLSAEMIQAEANNENLHKLAGLEIGQKELDESEPVMTRKEQQLKTVSNAYYHVIPKEMELLKTEKELRDLRENITKQKELKAVQEKLVQEAEQRKQEDEPKKLREDELNLQINEIQKSIKEYERLEAARTYKQNNEPKMNEIRKSISETKEAIEAKKQEIAGFEKMSETYTDVNAEVERAKQQRVKCYEELSVLTDSKTGVLTQCRQIRKEEAAFDELIKETDTYLKKAQAANDFHAKQNRLFLAGQAGILAERLGIELFENGTAVCPVCGTHLLPEDQIHFCEGEVDTPTEDEVKQAHDQMEQLSEAYHNKHQELMEKAQKLEGLKDNAVAAVNRLCVDCGSYEELTEGTFLFDLQKKLEDGVKAADTQIAMAVARQEAAGKLVKDLKTARIKLEEYGQALDDWKAREDELRDNLIRATETMERLQEQLPYKNVQEAKAQQDILARESQRLKEERETHEQELGTMKEQLSQTDGALATNLQSLPNKEEQAVSARESLEQALLEYQFSSIEEVHQRLLPVKEEARSVEQWIENRNRELNQYRVNRNTTSEMVRDLREKTEGVKEVDLEELGNQVLAAQEAQKKAGEAYMNFWSVKRNHESTRDRVAAAKGQLSGTDQAFRRIEKLYYLAAATKNSEGGKLSFERFVMGSMFKEILMMANQRLDIMTGGRYEMIHKTEAEKKNSKAGFYIDVLDHTTGKARSSDTLSGGESFLVSLSLALGLSDVVQERAGGIQLDSMFVDEGFGSLDENTLDKAVKVLERLTEGNRLVGIISHVTKLEECIGQQVQVRLGKRGSSIEIRS